jgi:hypothetical protein
MDNTYPLSTKRKFVLGSMLTFYLAIFTIGWLGIAVMVGMALDIGQNATAWAYAILGTALFLIVALTLVVPFMEIWKMLEGIVIRGQGISIGGDEILWEDIGEIYTNPDEEHITIFGVVPDETVARKYIFKGHYIRVDKLIDGLKNLDVNVIEDSELKSERFRKEA